MKNRSGFTLIELLVSLVVIGILSTLGYQQYTKVTTKAKATQLLSQLSIIQTGLAKYYTDMGTYPYDLSYLIKRPADDLGYDAISIATEGGTDDETVLEYWGGPYLDGIVIDPDAKNCLKADVGGSICFGASITDQGTFASPGISLTGPVNGNGDVISMTTDGGSMGSNPANKNLFNVLSINHIPKDMAKYIYTAANKTSPTSTGDLEDVAKGSMKNEDDEVVSINRTIGLPSDANYAKSNRLIYKYSDLY